MLVAICVASFIGHLVLLPHMPEMIPTHWDLSLIHILHARGADELGDDDALGAVDDEGALVGHHGEVAHEDELLLDLALSLIHI